MGRRDMPGELGQLRIGKEFVTERTLKGTERQYRMSPHGGVGILAN